MSKWLYKVNFRRFLTEENSREAMQAAAQGIRSEIVKLPPDIAQQAGQILDDMDQAAEAGKLTWFNASLSELWDFCDRERIWCQLP